MIDELTKKLVEDARNILEGKNPKEEEKEMDKVSGKELSKKFKDRDDKDIDNDGDTDDSDEYLHKRRQTIQKAMDTEGNKFTCALMSAKKNGKDHFVVSGKKYEVEEVSQCMSAETMKKLEAEYKDKDKKLQAGASYR